MSYRRVHARRRNPGRPRRTADCERLEGRFLLSAVAWTGAGDGTNWTDARNWSSNPALPDPSDDVTIAAATGAIHLASGSQSIHSLNSSEALSLDGGSLSVATTATCLSTVTLNGATVHGGTWFIRSSMVATAVPNTLDGVTLYGTLDLSTQPDAQATVINGLTVNGNVLIGGSSLSNYGRLMFGTESTAATGLSGDATVTFGASTYNAILDESNLPGDENALGLGVNMIHGSNGTISAAFPNGTLRSSSEIAADTGGTINVNFSSVANAGSLAAGRGILKVTGLTGDAGRVQFLPSAAGADNTLLSLDGNYTISQNPITVVAQATLQLNGAWNAASGRPAITVAGGRLQLGGIFSLRPGEIVQTAPTSSSGEPAVTIEGTLNGDLTLDASTGSWALSGTIIGGTVTESGGAVLRLAGSGGTLNGVTVDGPLNLLGAQLTVLNGLVLNGTMQVGQSSGGLNSFGYVYFGNSTTPAGTLTGTGTVVLGGNPLDSLSNRSSLPGSLLTIGQGVTILGAGTINGMGLINLGTIIASVSGSVLGIAGPITNEGTLSAAQGGELSLGGQVANTGTMHFQTGGSLIGNAALTINSGQVIFSDNQAPVDETLGGLTIHGSGVLDLGNNVLQITGQARPADALLRTYLHSGYDNGRWDGPGIISDSADATHALALVDSTDGIIPALAANTATIQLATIGDLNLDGKVDAADLLILAQHYGQTNKNWDQGDLNYDGSVGFEDLLLLARHYGAGTAPPAAAAASDSASANIDAANLRGRPKPLSRRLVPPRLNL